MQQDGQTGGAFTTTNNNNSPTTSRSPNATISNINPFSNRTHATSKDVDDLLHHQWCQYLCTLVIWGYGQAFLKPKNNAYNGPIEITATSTANTSRVASPEVYANMNGNVNSLRSRNPEAADYLEAMCTPTPSDLEHVEDSIKSHTKGEFLVLEE